MILLAASCGNDTEVVNEEQALTAPVSVHVNDFAFSVEPVGVAVGLQLAAVTDVGFLQE